MRYPSPGMYSMSSGVSTPAMTPPPVASVYDAMMANQPQWMSGFQKPDNAVLSQILHLQQQTNQLVTAIAQTTPSQPVYFPQQVQQRHTPSIPSNGDAQYQHLAQQVLSSAPAVDEATIARAVVVVANAMVNNRTGYIPNLRSSYDTMTPPILTPTAMRAGHVHTDSFIIHRASPPVGKPNPLAQSPVEATPAFGNKDDDEPIYN
jgi:hypothetical protein